MNTVKVMMQWSDIVKNYGYITRYSITSIRGNNDNWGHMRLNVGNSDDGTSVGCYLDIHGDGWITIGGGLHVTSGMYSDSYVSAKGQNTSSDLRLKNVLSPVRISPRDIAGAPSFRFAWKDGTGMEAGSSAQYWRAVLPEAVKERDGWLEMAYGNIALLSAISLARHVVSHESRIADLERENKRLKDKIRNMERRMEP